MGKRINSVSYGLDHLQSSLMPFLS